MARLTACFALSAFLVLASVFNANGHLPVLIPKDPDTGNSPFPGGPLPLTSPVSDALYRFLSKLPPVRIISRGNTSLSIAGDDNGNVFLARTNCRDARQLWVQHYPFVFGDRGRFSLVNRGSIDKLRAIKIPHDGSYPVKLAPYRYYRTWSVPVPASMLWKQEAPLFGKGDGFYKIRSKKNSSLFLDGLNGNVQEGTVVGAYPADHESDHVLWKIEGFLSNC